MIFQFSCFEYSITTLPVKITYLEKLEHPHENASMKTGALNRSVNSEMRMFRHRPSEFGGLARTV